MGNHNSTPNIGIDGNTAATRSMLMAGKDGSGNQQDLLIGTDGSLQVAATISPVTVSAATLSNVAASASSVTVLASNTSRKMATFYNDSTAILYLKFGSTASATSHVVQMVGGAYYELPSPIYTGIVTGIWASATGSVRVTELT